MQTTEQKEWLKIPMDLSEWVENPVLLKWIVADIDSLDWENPKLLAYLEQRPAFQPKMLLQLLTYAYAAGRFGSDEIGNLFYEDVAFHALGWNVPPKIKVIGRFRRDNRGLIKWALVQALKRSLRTQYDFGGRLLPGLTRFVVRNAVQRLDLARMIDRSAAED